MGGLDDVRWLGMMAIMMVIMRMRMRIHVAERER